MVHIQHFIFIKEKVFFIFMIPIKYLPINGVKNFHLLKKTEQRTYFVGLILKANDCQQLASSGFDAAYSYFAANLFTEASTTNRWKSIYEQCKPLPFIPSVGPGYIDTGVRPWNGETSRKRINGNYYKDGFRRLPRDNDNIITITSFNEWHEGTQIEPAIEKTGTKNNTYERYQQGPFMYIDLTRKLIFGT